MKILNNLTVVDELFNEAKIISDKSKRLALYEELAKIVEDDAVIVPLYFLINVFTNNSNLKIDNISVTSPLKIANMSWK